MIQRLTILSMNWIVLKGRNLGSGAQFSYARLNDTEARTSAMAKRACSVITARLFAAFCLLLLLFVPVMNRGASGEVVESQICFRH